MANIPPWVHPFSLENNLERLPNRVPSISFLVTSTNLRSFSYGTPCHKVSLTRSVKLSSTKSLNSTSTHLGTFYASDHLPVGWKPRCPPLISGKLCARDEHRHKHLLCTKMTRSLLKRVPDSLYVNLIDFYCNLPNPVCSPIIKVIGSPCAPPTWSTLFLSVSYIYNVYFSICEKQARG